MTTHVKFDGVVVTVKVVAVENVALERGDTCSKLVEVLIKSFAQTVALG